MALTRKQILDLFDQLNQRLGKKEMTGELYLVGGAVMSLVYNARPSTQDIDAVFLPATALRKIAQDMAREEGLDPGWLNDAVKGFFSAKGKFDVYLELSHLKIFVAQPGYILAMKCLSFRLGAEFYDEADIRYLLRHLNIESYGQALKIITQYYPARQFPQKTFYALQEILEPGEEIILRIEPPEEA